jgi:hypothetical protein
VHGIALGLLGEFAGSRMTFLRIVIALRHFVCEQERGVELPDCEFAA